MSTAAQALCTQRVPGPQCSVPSSCYHSRLLGHNLAETELWPRKMKLRENWAMGVGDGTARHAMALCQQRKALGSPRGALLRNRSQGSSVGAPRPQ